jgi:phage portal protein BeeE
MPIQNLFRRIFLKQSPSQTALAMQKVGQAVSTPRNYAGFSKEAYEKNVVAYRAITGISRSCGAIPFLLYKKRKGAAKQEIEEHPMLDLLMRPNPMQGRAAFIERLIAFFMIAGNTYIEASGPTPGAAPQELGAASGSHEGDTWLDGTARGVPVRVRRKQGSLSG